MRILHASKWLPAVALALFFGTAVHADDTEARKLDVIETIKTANQKIDPKQLATKWTKMNASAFAFFRATDFLYYHDLAKHIIAVPPEWQKDEEKISTWISADYHFQNVGFVDIGNGELLFAPNDFDESDRRPFYWDLIRCVSSIYLVADKDQKGVDSDEKLLFDFDNQDRDELAAAFLKTYFDVLKDGCPPSLDENQIRDISGKKGGWLSEKLDDWKSIAQTKKFWKSETGGSRDTFANAKPEKLGPLPAEQTDELAGGWENYRMTSANSPGANSNYFAMKAKGERFGSGLGSLGVKKIYVLIEGLAATPRDNVLLECKECPSSAMADQFPPPSQAPAYKSEAERVSMAMHKMLSQVEGHEGWFVAEKRSYHVTKMSPLGDGFKFADFEKKEDLSEFLQFAALALAAAHCHAEASFSENLGQFVRDQTGIKTTLAKLGKDYADQVRGDFAVFLAAPEFRPGQ